MYSIIRTFGSRCYPYLRNYATNKFDPRSLPCVFMGYSDKHKGYRCLQSSGRIYFSRHVVFDENNFPCAPYYDSHNDACDNPSFMNGIIHARKINLHQMISHQSNMQGSLMKHRFSPMMRPLQFLHLIKTTLSPSFHKFLLMMQ